MAITNKSKSFFDMTAAEREAFVQKLERGIPAVRLKPLSAKDRARWELARRRPGRPRKPAGTKAVPIRVTFEPALLAEIDSYTNRKGISRAEFLARGARLALEPRRRSA
jgi:hypothetical protein